MRRICVFGVVVVWTGLLSAAGQTPFERMTIDDSVKNPWAKIIADIDGDGFPDIIIGGQAGPLVWYRYPHWTKAIIADGGYNTVDGEAGDVDGDGDLDIVMGGLVWYENPLPAADPASRPWVARRVADHKTHDIELADLDRDGRLDIVTRDQSDFGAKAGDKVYLWRQEAGGKWTHRIIECPHGEGLALGDIDRDGDPDVVIGGIWFENDGRVLDGAWQAHKFCDWHPSASVEVADFNGDGRPDIVLAPSELKGNWHRLSWFEAPVDPKQGGWTEHVMVERIECVVHGLATGDFNRDGRIDIAISEMHQGDDPDEVVVFLNRDKGAAWDRQVLSTQGSHGIQVGDIGSDGDIDIIGANWSGPYQPVELWENRPLAGLWFGDWEYVVPIRVGAAGFDREIFVVEVPLDLTRMLAPLGRTAPGGDPEFRVLEAAAPGQKRQEVTSIQFERAPDYDPRTAVKGTLIFMLPKRMGTQAAQGFHVYFDFRHPAAKVTPGVVVEDVDHEGQDSFKISTSLATYYYHKRGAGFASIEDRDGNDWLSYNPGEGPVSKSGSGGKYRGIPNLVHPEGHFHPGGEGCTSRLVTPGPVKATIASESQDGKWACQWDIFPTHARMTVLKADRPYWFLYEGTPGGQLNEDTDYCVRCDGTRTPAGVRWDGDLQGQAGTGEWLYFCDAQMKRVLYLIHHEDDDRIDSYWPMNREMTVFGFGRKELNKHLTQVPAQFTIGFWEHNDFATVSRVVHSASRPLEVAVGSPEARR